MEAFNVMLAQIGRGQLVEMATEAMSDLVAAITDPELKATDAKGEITLKLSVTLERDTGSVRIAPALSLKKPKVALDRALFFVTPEGNLVRENPRQIRMFDDSGNVEAMERNSGRE
jgi:hypothetical protein